MPKLRFVDYVKSVALCCLLGLVAAVVLDGLSVGISWFSGTRIPFGILTEGLSAFVFVGGVVFGINRLLLLGKRPHRAVAAGLAIWIGSLFTIIPGLFLATLAFPLGRERLTQTPNSLPLLGQVVLYGFGTIVGLSILIQARRELAEQFRRSGLKLIYFPESNRKLRIYRVLLPFDESELSRRIEELPSSSARGLKKLQWVFAEDELLVSGERCGGIVTFFRPFGSGGEKVHAKIVSSGDSIILETVTRMGWGSRFVIFFTLPHAICASLAGLLTLVSLSPMNLYIALGATATLHTVVIMHRQVWLSSLLLEEKVIAFLEQRWGATVEGTPRRLLWPWF